MQCTLVNCCKVLIRYDGTAQTTHMPLTPQNKINIKRLETRRERLHIFDSKVSITKDTQDK